MFETNTKKYMFFPTLISMRCSRQRLYLFRGLCYADVIFKKGFYNPCDNYRGIPLTWRYGLQKHFMKTCGFDDINDPPLSSSGEVFCFSYQRAMKSNNFTNQCTLSDDEITKRIWTAYFVHWCYLLPCGNVILPSTENYSFSPLFPSGLKTLGKIMRVSGVISAFGNMTLPQCNKSHHYIL